VRRRGTLEWTQVLHAGAIAIGGFGRSRWRGGRGGAMRQLAKCDVYQKVREIDESAKSAINFDANALFGVGENVPLRA